MLRQHTRENERCETQHTVHRDVSTTMNTTTSMSPRRHSWCVTCYLNVWVARYFCKHYVTFVGHLSRMQDTARYRRLRPDLYTGQPQASIICLSIHRPPVSILLCTTEIVCGKEIKVNFQLSLTSSLKSFECIQRGIPSSRPDMSVHFRTGEAFATDEL